MPYVGLRVIGFHPVVLSLSRGAHIQSTWTGSRDTWAPQRQDLHKQEHFSGGRTAHGDPCAHAAMQIIPIILTIHNQRPTKPQMARQPHTRLFPQIPCVSSHPSLSFTPSKSISTQGDKGCSMSQLNADKATKKSFDNLDFFLLPK